jgi:hypothetical protein
MSTKKGGQIIHRFFISAPKFILHKNWRSGKKNLALFVRVPDARLGFREGGTIRAKSLQPFGHRSFSQRIPIF